MKADPSRACERSERLTRFFLRLGVRDEHLESLSARTPCPVVDVRDGAA
jgi:hypothetical protein